MWIANPSDGRKGFCGNCDNSELDEIRCIVEGLIDMKSDALARASFQTCLVSFRSILFIQAATMATSGDNNNNGGGGGGCNRLHRPGGGEFSCLKKEEWEELVDEVVGVMEQLEMLEDVEGGDEQAQEAWVAKDWDNSMGREYRAPPTVEGARTPAAHLMARLAILRRRLFDRVSRRITGNAE